MAKIRIYAVENGPYIVEIDGKTNSALCRCGGSNNKPYCDGTHRKINFLAHKANILDMQ
jgi:CDGSH-type Zn-finger protein